jgi:hypothetical protein
MDTLVHLDHLPEIDCQHWLDPGLVDVDVRHWIPYLTAEELGLGRRKLVLGFAPNPPVLDIDAAESDREVG